MSIAFVKKVGELDVSNSNLANSLTVASAVAAGDILCFAAAAPKSNSNAVTITDSDGGNTWTSALIAQNDGTNDWKLWFFTGYMINGIGTSGTVTMTETKTGFHQKIGMCAQFSGLISNPAEDKIVSAAGTNTTPSSGATATRSLAAELLVSCCTTWNGTALTAGTNFTPVAHTTAFLAIEWQIVAATGTDAGTWTRAAGADWWEAGLVTYEGFALATNPSWRNPIGMRAPLKYA